MNDFTYRLGALAHSVGKDYALTAPDDAAQLVRRARRGRIVWTGAVGTVSLASAAVIALGGSAAANSLGATAQPAHHSDSTDPATEVIDPVQAGKQEATAGDPAHVVVIPNKDADPAKSPKAHHKDSHKHHKAHKAHKANKATAKGDPNGCAGKAAGKAAGKGEGKGAGKTKGDSGWTKDTSGAKDDAKG